MASIYDSLVHQKVNVYRPGEVEYERSVAASNLVYRFSRPSYVVQPAHASEVQIIVQEAQAEGLRLTIKGGGHSYAGFSTANDGILLDLVKMNDVHLDIAKETVTMQGGAQWGHVYKRLVNGQHDGYVVNGGRCPTVGISGFTLGGGLGPFTRSFGMGCDTVESATIVNAKGELVTATSFQHKDLFWALRGAGGGNFGILVKMKMKVKKLHDSKVVAGRYTWYPKLSDSKKPDPEVARTLMTNFMVAMQDFYKAQWSNEMTIDSSWLCELEKTDAETPIGVRFLVYYNGTEPKFQEEIKKKSGATFPSEDLMERSIEEPSTLFLHETLVAQWSEEIQKSFPANKTFNFYTSFCFDERADFNSITKIIRDKMLDFRTKFKGEKGLLQVTWIHSGGEAENVPSDQTAVYWRGARFHTYIMIQWEEKFLGKRMMGFLKEFEEILRPESIEGVAKYINFADARLHEPTEEGLPLPGKSYFGKNITKLQKVKADVDKHDFFRWSQSIQPEPRKRKADEVKLIDLVAGQQWVDLGKDVTRLTTEGTGGVFALTDLGF
ncbi:hypothetical protein G7Z17_g800 [Cylindrodendrum hubeiense]|uniref:FAD-binding PCMH-type domain-containing protein n=1 Tax=Cylindrodendrum hubeiense TaxID=595255 RepID=A0A9P5HKH6_9HYPO|nr:hypothetical protein G7Z17_g800 [Cylindrodendrum hubeiense]